MISLFDLADRVFIAIGSTDAFASSSTDSLASRCGRTAVLPSVVLGEQNRYKLTHEDSSYMERGNFLIRNTPFGRSSHADQQDSALHHLLSDDSQIVTGTIMPVDGGIGAFSELNHEYRVN